MPVNSAHFYARGDRADRRTSHTYITKVDVQMADRLDTIPKDYVISPIMMRGVLTHPKCGACTDWTR